MKAVLRAALAGAALCSIVPAVQAADGPWMVRVRAARLVPADSSDAIPSLGVPSDKITVSKKTIPDFDVSYFFSPNVAAELLLTIPQKHDVTVEQSVLGGPVKIGTFKHLPPTLLAQYHFMPDQAFKPYVGAGINLTLISSVNLAVPTVGKLDLDNTSVGGALQVGFDYRIDKNLYLNVDVKKIWIDSDVKLNGAKVSNVGVNPLLYGVGIGWRF